MKPPRRQRQTHRQRQAARRRLSRLTHRRPARELTLPAEARGLSEPALAVGMREAEGVREVAAPAGVGRDFPHVAKYDSPSPGPRTLRPGEGAGGQV